MLFTWLIIVAQGSSLLQLRTILKTSWVSMVLLEFHGKADLALITHFIPRAILYEVVCILKTNCGYQLTRSIDETSFVVAHVKVC